MCGVWISEHGLNAFIKSMEADHNVFYSSAVDVQIFNWLSELLVVRDEKSGDISVIRIMGVYINFCDI